MGSTRRARGTVARRWPGLAGAVSLGLGVVGVACRDEPAAAPSTVPPPRCPVVPDGGVPAGGFTDLTTPIESLLPAVPPAPEFGTGPLSLAVVGDVDGDGAPDVLFGTQGDPAGARGFRYEAATGSLAPLSGPWLAVNPRGIVDLDGDGRDEVIGTGEVQGTGRLPVLWGGDGTFVPLLLTPDLIAVSALWFDDIDQDGWIDLLVGDDSRRQCDELSTVRAFLQSAPRRFEERPGLIPAVVRVGDGAVLSAPLGGRRVIVAAGDQGVCGAAAPTFFTDGPRTADGYPTFEPLHVVDGTFGGPMGTSVVDLDQDGSFDLAVSQDPQLHLWRGGGSLPLALVPEAGGMATLAGSLGAPQKPWAMGFFDLDQDGRADAVVTHGNHNVFPTDAPIGPQRTAVYLQGPGDFCMREAPGDLGLGRDGDWRSLAVGDLDADGDVDLAVGGRGISARVYRNELRTGRHGFALRLRGTTSNALGIGAQVEVRITAAGPVQHHLVGGFAPPVVLSAPLVFVGLGDAVAAAEVTVRWPSGTVQVLRGLTAGATHLVVEPSVLALDPPSRRCSADGTASVRVRVTPRGPDGALASGASVGFRLVAGGGTLGAPVTADGETSVAVTSPTTRGSSVLEVTVDGQALAVRPRIWWE